MDWSGRSLIGAWTTTSGTPNTLGGLVTKGYLENAAVTRTGNLEFVSGTKTFIDPISFGVISASYIAPSGNTLNGIDLTVGKLRFGAATYTLNWWARVLSGNWITDGAPQTSQGVVNKNYLETGNYTGVIHQTGINQSITGGLQVTLTTGNGGVDSFNVKSLPSGNLVFEITSDPYVYMRDFYGNTVFSTEESLLFYNGIPSLNWQNRTAYDSVGAQAMSWDARALYDGLGYSSLTWGSGVNRLLAKSGAPVLNFDDPTGIYIKHSGSRPAGLQGGYFAFSVNESTNTMFIHVRYSNGTFKSGSINLV